jgi:hypothetical protein
MRAGLPYLTGEQGREIVIPRVDSTVLPNNVSERILGAMNGAGAGTGPITISAPFSIGEVNVRSEGDLAQLQQMLEAHERGMVGRLMDALESIGLEGVA